MKDEAWLTTPNPWWRFLSDRPAVPTPPVTNSGRSAIGSRMLDSERSLAEAETEWTLPVISERKMLQNRPIECLLLGNLHRVKLLQIEEPVNNVTVLIKASQGTMGIIKHSVTLLRGRLERRMELLEAWMLRDIEEGSSLSHFDAATCLNKIMNILIWNCRGAMKPQFRQTVLDLVAQHSPIVLVITETRLSGAKADEIIEGLPFDGAAVADTIGFAGGIWMLWRSDLVQMEVLAATEQEIHALIRVRSQTFNWLISAIYASPRFAERCVLWENLKMLAALHNLPWAIMGDFNEVISEEEKSGGNPVVPRRVNAILDCMDTCQMMDLGFSGPKFTWSNKRELGNLIQCRLDRCWANPAWKVYFSEANVTHLAKINSDHCPLLLNLNPDAGPSSSRPFRFQSVWLSHKDFPAVVRDAWTGLEDNLEGAISRFTTSAQKWNKEIFGNVFTRKKKILNRLLGIQRALANRPCTFLINLQDHISEEYNHILQLEEELWAMKARTNWIIFGERNTAFFHQSTLARRSRNKITSIQDVNGNWVHNLEGIKEIIVANFKKLYQLEQSYWPLEHPWCSDWCASLSDEEANSLDTIPSNEEIWRALKSMKPYKAPGVDGLHAGFFQRFWLLVGDSVKKEVREIFERKEMPEFLNQTLIVLIPKQLGPEVVGHYRPISLCNTVYKIVSKILVHRLRPLLPSIISPMQAAFLEGRRSADNVIIAQELIYSLKGRRGKDGFMIIKIDLEKAYDRLEWSFIRMVLVHFGVPDNIVKLIMSCVSSTTTSISINGSKMDPFQPSRGIRQGDPLSPYLFIMCMEFLGAQIAGLCNQKRWDAIKASRNGPSFSHIFFADDLLLFAKANSKNCEAILEVLDNFCNLAGQKVNKAKSRILFSPNVARRRKRRLCNKLGVCETSDLGRYLGFPLLHQGRNGNAFNFVAEKISAKLAGWKSRLLSRAGRLVLIKSAAAPIADYYMQCHALPIKVCNAIDKKMRDFVWGSNEEKKKMHMVNWQTVTQPKELGGLGLFQTRHRNQALLAKLCWRLASEQEALWARMLIAKYMSTRRLTEGGRTLPCSRIWAACKVGGPVYVKGLKWTVSNGRSINFWKDFWLPCGPIRNLIEGPLTGDEEQLTVQQGVDFRFSGDVRRISFELPDQVLSLIKAVPFALNQDAEDTLIWAFSKDGFFSLESAYLLARGSNPLNLGSSSMSWIWKADTHPRVHFFLWLCSHNSLPTGEVLGSRGLNLNLLCTLCHQGIESVDHLLRGCIVAQDF
ncbi:hypothetical protein SO802_007970 [Lithocarpus litseifolius]|uniref:Reverse transcriptase domain-containing protein n=1 Tax=Lithocarpus litseifolius TaxID=425828 RepID=A0AAW2DQ48_9ROSI